MDSQGDLQERLTDDAPVQVLRRPREALQRRARAAQASLALTRFDYNQHQPRDADGKWTDGTPGVDSVPDGSLDIEGLGVYSSDDYDGTYGDVEDEQNVDLGTGSFLTARYFKNGDAHLVLDLPGGQTQVLEEMNPKSMRDLSYDIEEMLNFDEDRAPDDTGVVADIDSPEHGFYVARYETGDIKLQPGGMDSGDYLDLTESEAADLVEALRDMADGHEEEFG